MSLHTFLNPFRVAATAMAVFAAAPALIFAQGETFTDCDAWAAAVCGSVLDDDFESFVDFDGNQISANFFGPVPSPQSLVWGEVSQDGNDPAAVSVFRSETSPFSAGTFFDDAGDGRPAVFTPNTTALGPLEGICFKYLSTESDATVSFNAYDGETLVASIPLPNATDAAGAAVPSTFGWQNTEGLNVTRFEFAIERSATGTVSPTGIVGDGQLSFGDGCDPSPVSCFDQLALVEASLESYVATLTDCEAYYAQGSLDCVNWMQNDCFWEQPSGNRLSRYGGSMFIGAAYAVCYLEWVDTPEADLLIDELVAVLECIVDHEIAYAIENGGSQCFIDRAEDYAELGSIIDEDFDNEVVATLAYRLAWLHAYYATQ
ncbi:hypothetical protein [Mariniblastus fucicola]|uniref:Uncharacterized protein n=1 Tax=Mariniblastus fucicola TaxID=980251 RepID=A0A5B9PK14_9BACT|nr:hypothetical protein [Mariniblastus fucicola]QEG25016.1 hypothetical protein MFFC18_49390 [Mariniblastus fucicola]